MIQEPVITLRDDRYCIPVKAEHRREFGGLVHDQSSSGATVFMEPQVVVELGNELRELMIKERHEIERILAQISALVAARAFDIQTTVHALGHLDMVSAKARWADSRRCVEPELDGKGSLVFYGARHPLLQGDVVPIDVRLGGDFTALLITGPNTGGKTVTLKTVGLLTLLAQSGLHIPADPGTRVAIFRNVFADIGDEQSIQQSLSTFSSHIRQISRIVTEANNQSLVLLDEIGAGTDPQEGAALAKSILAFLMERGVRIMASTHYGELKEFAMTAPGVENASVEFNHETLSPTYRLLVGVPGASNALNIASRLGLNKSIIDGARKMVDPDRRSLEEAYLRMEERRLAAEKAESSARQSLAEIEKLKREYQREYQALRNRKEETTRKASEQARDVVRRAQDEAKQILSDLRRAGREDRSTEQARQRLSKLNAAVASQMETVESPVPTVREDLAPKPPKESPALDQGYQELEVEPEVGDEVIATTFGRQGVLRRREGKDAEVQFGAMRMTVPVSTLRKITRTGPSPARREAQRMGAISVEAASTVPSEIHLRGMRAEEALVAVDEYLDQARLAGLRTLRLVHGKGTGALRKVLWSHLKDDPSIKSFAHPPEAEGGAGATVVEFKD
jgi:DNA mismatch repair protein MutS2